MSEHFIGVDGGGTRTRAVVADAEGRELARTEGPASIADADNPAAAAEVIAGIAGAAAHRAGVPLPVASLFAGIAGAGREGTRSAVEVRLRRMGVADEVRIDTDIVGAFHDAFEGKAGLLVASGTGSIAWGRDESGREARVGGWGSLLGDEGGGYGVGLDALRRVTRAHDGRGRPTALTEGILAALDVDGVDDLVGWIASARKADVAALVPVVAREAAEGDRVASDVLARAVEDLEGHLTTLLERLGPWTAPPRVALTGGLLAPGGPLRSGMEAVIERHGLVLVDHEPDPVRGAVRLAMEL